MELAITSTIRLIGATIDAQFHAASQARSRVVAPGTRVAATQEDADDENHYQRDDASCDDGGYPPRRYQQICTTTHNYVLVNTVFNRLSGAQIALNIIGLQSFRSNTHVLVTWYSGRTLVLVRRRVRPAADAWSSKPKQTFYLVPCS